MSCCGSRRKAHKAWLISRPVRLRYVGEQSAQVIGNGLVPVNTGPVIPAGLSLGIVKLAVRLMPGPASVAAATGRLIVTIVAEICAPVIFT